MYSVKAVFFPLYICVMHCSTRIEYKANAKKEKEINKNLKIKNKKTAVTVTNKPLCPKYTNLIFSFFF